MLSEPGWSSAKPSSVPENAFRLINGDDLGYKVFDYYEQELSDKPLRYILYVPGNQGTINEPEMFNQEGLKDVRVIVVEPPGVGRSTGKGFHQPSDWVLDVKQLLADQLPKDADLWLSSYSQGFRYAAALAADEELGKRFQGFIPISPVGGAESGWRMFRLGYPFWLQLLFFLARHYERHAWARHPLHLWLIWWKTTIHHRTLWKTAFRWYTRMHASVDRKILNRPGVPDSLVAMYRDGFAQGGFQGFIENVVAAAKPWPAILNNRILPFPGIVWSGTEDRFVGKTSGRWIAGKLGFLLQELENEGHRLIYRHWPDIIQQLLKQRPKQSTALPHAA